MDQLKLYEVDEDRCVQTSVAATSPEEAKALAFPPGAESEADEITVTEMTQERAEKISVHMDDGRDKMNLWQVFKEATEASVLCCSEW